MLCKEVAKGVDIFISFWCFFKRQIIQIYYGGFVVLSNKFKKISSHIFNFPLYVLALPFVLIMRMISPFFLIRFQGMLATRIGHLAGNIELYLCEQDAGINVPNQKYFDIFFVEHGPVCNPQIFLMWKRILNIFPHHLIYPLMIINRLIPGGSNHEIGISQRDRDIHNLYDKFPSHLEFSEQEERFGREELVRLGIPRRSKFICLTVRDSAYLENLTYHSYRDGNIDNYVLAAEELADRGYYVIRMGAKVIDKMPSEHKRVIDYASNGMRTDFMDVYLGAKCLFCISTSTGFDAIPTIFRKPIVFSTVPVAFIYTFSVNFLSIFKHHISIEDNKELTMTEISAKNLGYALATKDYENSKVTLSENTPEEIRDVSIEMLERINGNWVDSLSDKELQEKAKRIFKEYLASSNVPKLFGSNPMHGEIFSFLSTSFLRKNKHLIK